MPRVRSRGLPRPVQPFRFRTAVALALGLVSTTLGAWALLAPPSFARVIAPFAPYNAHYLHDLGALQLGSGGHPIDAPLLAALTLVALLALLPRLQRWRPDAILQKRPAAISGTVLVRRAAFAVLWLALLEQAGWMVARAFVTHARGDKTIYDSVIVAAFAALAVTRGRVRPIAGALRILVGLTLLGSVADRFGLLGPPGAPGVSWGAYAPFVVYTRAVNAFLPANWAPLLAALATALELVLGLALVLGLRPRYAAAGAATLLILFGSAMTLSLGLAAAGAYAVGVLAAGAWALATVDATSFSLDAWWTRRHARRRPDAAIHGDADHRLKASSDGR